MGSRFPTFLDSLVPSSSNVEICKDTLGIFEIRHSNIKGH
jgi:hypothetical protein